MSVDPLYVAAAAARNKAHAPFSNFKVGAALEAMDGLIYAGCNVESASYGLTICAERVALVKAVSDGIRKFRRIAIFAETDDPTPPCGACRQLLWELCGNIEVHLVNHKKQSVCYMLGSDLLPMPFDSTLLKPSGAGSRPASG